MYTHASAGSVICFKIVIPETEIVIPETEIVIPETEIVITETEIVITETEIVICVPYSFKTRRHQSKWLI